MDEYRQRELLEDVSRKQYILWKKTDELLALLMEMPEENRKWIPALRSMRDALDSYYFSIWNMSIIWNERDMQGRGNAAWLEHWERVRQIKLEPGPDRYAARFSDWNEEKERYLDCVDAYCRWAESERRRKEEAEREQKEAERARRIEEELRKEQERQKSEGKKGNTQSEKAPFWKLLFKGKASGIMPVPPCACAPNPPEPEPVSQTEGQPVRADQVFFTAVAPKEFRRDEYSDVAVVMYEEAYRHIVDRIKENYDGKAAEYGSGSKPVAKQTVIRVAIESPEQDIGFDKTDESGVWLGKSLEFHFWVLVPKDFQKKQFKLMVRVFTDDVPFTTLTLFVRCNAASPQEITPERRDIRSAFVSYAREDTEEVTTLIRGMEKVRPDLNVFMDQESLRSGQNWQEVLKAEIDQRDMLFLCWSPEAKASEWVDFEWRYMYTRRGIEHIDPIPLISPISCPPPEELSKLHFDDRWLRYRKHKRAPEAGEQESF